MSLNIYSSILDVPEGMKVIRYNDSFFNSFTKLNNSDFEKTVLRDIDDATFVSPDLVIGRFIKAGAVHKSTLSTGVKTILNIEKHPDWCFDMLECGKNVLYKLCDLSSGNAILKNTLIAYPGKGVPCDIKYRGKLYKDFGAFISDFYNDIDEDVSDEYALLQKSFN